jgi:AcrR family transcriptional regulator
MSAVTTPRAPTVDRRVRKTRAALRSAFVSLVLERGYDAVTVEDLAERADVARATFYAHFSDKEELLTTMFEEMTSEVTQRVTQVEGAPEAPRVDLVRDLYEHAEAYRDLYLICLRGAGDGRARAAYLDVITPGAEVVYTQRQRAQGNEPLLPLRLICRGYAGAHVALLEEWLERDDREPPAVAAERQTELLGNGLLWAMQALPAPAMAAFLKPRD